ncbi:MAG: cell wall hydrolase [Actinobacteria bacterium]|nr:cell wall hydrolase [Actinomycetota bacterium]
MISNSDTVQTLTLGLAFTALFIGATASLPNTAENVLYTTKNTTNTTASAEDEAMTVNTLHSLLFNTALASAVPERKDKKGSESIEDTLTRIATELNNEMIQEIELAGGKSPREVHEQAQDRARMSSGENPVMTQFDKREVLWLARIMYSETKRAEEQKLIGWVVRNRVDTGYTGRTYEDVAKYSAQFSGLHPTDKRYEHNISRWYKSSGESWQSALSLAKEVYFADDSERPLALTTRHFYSPNAVSRTPAWAKDQQAVKLIKDPKTNTVRFALYDKVR